jgi:hypothetical protein
MKVIYFVSFIVLKAGIIVHQGDIFFTYFIDDPYDTDAIKYQLPKQVRENILGTMQKGFKATDIVFTAFNRIN